MATQRAIEVKVGFFVLLCLAIGGALIWQFGKIKPGRKDRYPLIVMFDNVGGLIPNSAVMYAGVTIGNVSEIKLVEDGKMRAQVRLALDPHTIIHRDAKFVINQSGLLGDRYVDVIPGSPSAPRLKAGAKVEGSPSVDLTEAIRGVIDILRQTAGTIDRVNVLIRDVNTAVRRIDGAIARVDEIVLSTQSLAHVANALANIDASTSNAVALTVTLRDVVEENRIILTNTFGQFQLAAQSVSGTAQRMDGIVRNAEKEVRDAVKDLSSSAEKLRTVMERLEQGDGTLGRLLVDPALHDELLRLVQNLRQHGLLYREGPATKSVPRREEEPARRGKTPLPARPAQTGKE
jgi:phospholipid/cholesterol/gamma-HCH transport system substrate-binding protein